MNDERGVEVARLLREGQAALERSSQLLARHAARHVAHGLDHQTIARLLAAMPAARRERLLRIQALFVMREQGVNASGAGQAWRARRAARMV